MTYLGCRISVLQGSNSLAEASLQCNSVKQSLVTRYAIYDNGLKEEMKLHSIITNDDYLTWFLRGSKYRKKQGKD